MKQCDELMYETSAVLLKCRVFSLLSYFDVTVKCINSTVSSQAGQLLSLPSCLFALQIFPTVTVFIHMQRFSKLQSDNNSFRLLLRILAL